MSSFNELFDSAYEYASGQVPFSAHWSEPGGSQCLIETKHSQISKVMYSNNPVTGERYIFLPTDVGNVVIEEREDSRFIAHVPPVLARLLGVAIGGSAISSAEEFRLFYDPLFKTTIGQRVTALKGALQVPLSTPVPEPA